MTVWMNVKTAKIVLVAGAFGGGIDFYTEDPSTTDRLAWLPQPMFETEYFFVGFL